jgi:hypothetical protein
MDFNVHIATAMPFDIYYEEQQVVWYFNRSGERSLHRSSAATEAFAARWCNRRG